MRTTLTADAIGEAKGDPADAQDQETEVIHNPVILAVFDVIVKFPVTVLFLVFSGCIVSGVIQEPFTRLKNEPLDLKPRENRLTSVTNALKDDFQIEGSSENPDALIIWCDSCDLTTVPAFDQALQAVDAMLTGLKQNDAACEQINWQLYQPNMPASETQMYMARDRTASVVLLNRYEKLEVGQVSGCITSVRKSLADLDGKYGGLHIALGNPIATAMISVTQEITSVTHHVCISVPILSFLFYMYVGSVFKVFTALLSLVATQLWVRAVVVLIKKSWSNFNYSGGDTTVMFIQLALALDYAVIFWGRFRQERLREPSKEAYLSCVLTTLKTAGLVIMVSVAVLEVGFGGMLFYPDLNNNGNLSMVIMMMVSCVAVGLHSLLIPAALAACLPSTFDVDSSPMCRCPCLFRSSSSNDHGTAMHQEPQPSAGERFFRWYAKLATRPPWVFVLPILAYALLTPFLYELFQYQPYYDVLEDFMDKTLPEYGAFKVYKDRFTTNRASPSMMLLKAERLEDSLLQATSSVGEWEPQRLGWRPNAAALVPEAAERAPALGGAAAEAHVRRFGGARRAALLSRALTAARPTLQAPPKFDLVTLSPQFRNLTCSTVEAILRGTNNTKYQIQSVDIDSIWWDAGKGRCSSFPNLLKSPISKDGTEQVMMVYPTYDAFGIEAQDLTHHMWDKLEPSVEKTFEVGGATYRFTAQYSSGVGAMMLGDAELTRCAPKVIGFTVIAICTVVGIFFRSVGVGLKVLLSVVVPILANYGLMISMWQKGWFQWAGVTPTGGVISVVMFSTFGFLLGLAIDYDVVLFARVYERRMQGYDNLSAVQMGLVETGPMITLAGTLMTVSFCVMCFDPLASIRQLAGLYFLGVAIDTYIVRTCVAPTMLVLGGRLNYWPNKVPPETKSYDL